MYTNRVTPEDLVSRTADLVSLPDIYIRLKTVVDDPESSMADVADVVANDPALTARLLKIANSPYFRFPAKITTVARATSLLGTQQIHDLVLATTVAETFSGIPSELIGVQDFWSNSIRCGLLCRRLAQECNVLDSRAPVRGRPVARCRAPDYVPRACPRRARQRCSSRSSRTSRCFWSSAN